MAFSVFVAPVLLHVGVEAEATGGVDVVWRNVVGSKKAGAHAVEGHDRGVRLSPECRLQVVEE